MTPSCKSPIRTLETRETWARNNFFPPVLRPRPRNQARLTRKCWRIRKKLSACRKSQVYSPFDEPRKSVVCRFNLSTGARANLVSLSHNDLWDQSLLFNKCSYCMASSVSGQDESNPALWLATLAGNMELSCPLGTTRRVLQEKFSRKPYNVLYWPSLFGQDGLLLVSFPLCEFMELDSVSVH